LAQLSNNGTVTGEFCLPLCEPIDITKPLCNECLATVSFLTNHGLCAWIPGLSYLKCLKMIVKGGPIAAALCAVMVKIGKEALKEQCQLNCVEQRMQRLICKHPTFGCACRDGPP
jgi:hypothetical protein